MPENDNLVKVVNCDTSPMASAQTYQQMLAQQHPKFDVLMKVESISWGVSNCFRLIPTLVPKGKKSNF